MNRLTLSVAAIEKFLKTCDDSEAKFDLSCLSNEESENSTGPDEECPRLSVAVMRTILIMST